MVNNIFQQSFPIAFNVHDCFTGSKEFIIRIIELYILNYRSRCLKICTTTENTYPTNNAHSRFCNPIFYASINE